MFEVAVALKYLLPRRKQLSVSIIGLLSVLVIALVVWLLIVFLSVTRGIEHRWMETLVALNAPLRLTPTQAYYDSYYYQIDRYSLAANYAEQTIGEKLTASISDPYDPMMDPELPDHFPQPARASDGSLLDPVKGAYEAVAHLQQFPGTRAHEFEVGLANLRLHKLRRSPNAPNQFEQSFINQATYLGSLDGNSRLLTTMMRPPTGADVTHQLQLLALSGENIHHEMPQQDGPLDARAGQEQLQPLQLQTLMRFVTVKELVTSSPYWVVPYTLYPTSGTVRARIIDGVGVFDLAGEVDVDFASPPEMPLAFPPDVLLRAELLSDSLETASAPDQVLFAVSVKHQGVKFAGHVPYAGLAVASCDVATSFSHPPESPPSWRYQVGNTHLLPSHSQWGEGVLLAKAFQDQGTLVGDRGYLSYYAATPSGLAEQRLPIFVAGFYDPGPLPTGARYVLANSTVTGAVRASVNQVEAQEGNGIHVWIDDLDQVDEAKTALVAQLDTLGIAPFWKVETFKEYEFARPLVEQFQSDRNLLAVIAIIVIAVACSNIISMLIVLVNDKRREIGILRSMGATSTSIATIFALCGVVMGVAGSILGIGAALLTLAHLDDLIYLLGQIQGHEAFQTSFYGATLPSQLDGHVLGFVIAATAAVSLLAGLIPALKAALLRPATILRTES